MINQERPKMKNSVHTYNAGGVEGVIVYQSEASHRTEAGRTWRWERQAVIIDRKLFEKIKKVFSEKNA